jgi:uncharacterized protein (TIGR02444 family)
VSAGTPSFWEFSLAVYANTAVQRECLDLQDRHGVDVNLLLHCAYVGAVHHALLSASGIAEAKAAVEEWQREVVRPLRSARRALKGFVARRSAIAAGAGALRTSVKAAELQSERLEQAMLEEWTVLGRAAWPVAGAEQAVAHNVGCFLAACAPAAASADVPRNLIAAALAAVGVRT